MSNKKSKVEKKIGIKSFLRNGKRVKAFRRRQKVNREENKARNRLLIGLGTTAALGVGGIAAAKLIKNAKNKKLANTATAKVSNTFGLTGKLPIAGQEINLENTVVQTRFISSDSDYHLEFNNKTGYSDWADFGKPDIREYVATEPSKAIKDLFSNKYNLDLDTIVTRVKDKTTSTGFLPFINKDGNSMLFVQSVDTNKVDFRGRLIVDSFLFKFDKDTNLTPIVANTGWFNSYLKDYQKVWQASNNTRDLTLKIVDLPIIKF